MAASAGKILIVDDDEDILTAARLLLKRQYALVETCKDPLDIPALMQAHSFDAILLDMNFTPGDSSSKQGFYWLDKILQVDPRQSWFLSPPMAV